MKVPDPTFVAVAVLLGATLDEALASLDGASVDDGANASERGNAATSMNASPVIVRALRSTDRMTRARALAAGIEPVMRELAAWDDFAKGIDEADDGRENGETSGEGT